MADFTAEVRRFMTERGMSLRGLARAAGYDPSYLSKILSGRKPASPYMARCLDEALGAGGAIEQTVSPPADLRADSQSPALVEAYPGPVAPELVGYFRGQLPGHYQADMFLGPRHLVPTVKTQTELIIQLVQTAEARVRRDLLGVGAAYTALLGWLYQDAGDLRSSARWRDLTLALAHRSGDPQLVSYALTNKAMMAIDLGDGRAVVDFAHAPQAAALAALPDPERVTSIAAGAASLVRETGSARLRRELVALRDQARGWPQTAARRELGEIIAS